MSQIWVYIAFDGDHIGRQVGRASLADNPEELRKLSQAIERGNDIWRSWVLAKGGEVISIGGDEGRLRVGADHLEDLPALRIQYAKVVGADVSVGIGTRLSEADKALLAGKLQGGNRIVLYTPDIEEQLAKVPEKSEAEKLSDEYLTKADEPAGPKKPQAQPALNSAAAGGGISGPSTAGPAGPEAPIEEGSEHSENEALGALIENAPGGGGDLHQDLGALADQQSADDQADQQSEDDEKEAAGEKDGLKKQIISILKVWKDRADELEQLQKQDPELYKSLVGMMQALIAMSKEFFGGDDQQDANGGEIQKSEECKHFFGKGKKCLKCKQAKEDLDKAALEAGKTGVHHLQLPVGSQKDPSASGTREAGKIKVQHPEDGKTSWKSVRAGQVMSQDGHAISSRNPGGK